MRPPVLLLLAALVGTGSGYAWFWRPAARLDVQPLLAVDELANGANEGPRDASSRAAETAADKAALLIAAAQHPGDPLRCTHDLFLAIQQLEARDFSPLTGEPVGTQSLEKLLKEMPWNVKQEVFSGFVTRWLEVDANAAVAWFRSGPEILKKDRGAEETMLRVLAQKRPEDVLAHVLGLPLGDKRKSYAQMLMAALGESDPARAAQWIERFPDKATRESAEFGRREAIVKSDPLAAMDFIAALSDRWEASGLMGTAVSEASQRGVGVLRALAAKTTDPEMLAQIALAMIGYDPEEAARMTGDLLAKGGNARGRAEGSLHTLGAAFAKKDTRRAAEWADELPGAFRARALASVAQVWAASDPQAAVEWFATHPARESNQPDTPVGQRLDAGASAFGVWLERDETAARAWAAALPAGEVRDSANARLIVHLTQNRRAAEAATLREIVTADATGWLARQVVEGIAKDDPLAAANWAAEMPAGRAQAQAVEAAVKRWGERDPASAAAWIEQFPSGEVRDRAVASYAEMTAGADPQAAAEWVLQVEDSWQRTTAAQNLFWRWHGQDAVAALAWFRAVPGLDEEVRRQILHDNYASP